MTSRRTRAIPVKQRSKRKRPQTVKTARRVMQYVRPHKPGPLIPMSTRAAKAELRAVGQSLLSQLQLVRLKRGGLTRWRDGTLRGRTGSIDVMQTIISPRGRGMIRGVTNVMEKPLEDMPQSTQDYFLTSRAIRYAAYDLNRLILEITFQTGYRYQFFNVPRSVWENFKMAQSKGRFFMEQIYGYWDGPKGHMTYHPNYNYKRVR